MKHLFTIVCEFRGGTYTKQLKAGSQKEAFGLWAALFKTDDFLSPIEVVEFAEEIENSMEEDNMVPLESLQNVWYEGFSIGDDLLEVLIINTNEAKVNA